MNDLRFALRQLRKHPGFTAVAVLSLALGIGACVAVFSVVNGVLLRSLPVPNPHELRVIQWTGVDARMRSISGHFEVHGSRVVAECVSPPLFDQLREQSAALADLFGFAPSDDVIAQARSQAFTANGMVVSDNFFPALGVRPLLGRLFAPGASDPDAVQHVVISHDWWERHFARDPAVIGQTLTLNATRFTIIGVLPRGFSGVRPGEPREFYTLLTSDSPFWQRAVSVPDHWWLRMMARMRSGVDDRSLKAALEVVFARGADGQMKQPGILVQPGHGGLAFERNAYGRPLLLMLGAVGLVMLVACANLAGLLLARGTTRQHEFAVRAALGARRGSLLRQSLTESLALAVLGGGLGVVLAVWGRNTIARLLVGSSEGLRLDVSMDFTVMGFAVGAAIITALLSGVLPALRAAGADPGNGLKARNALGVPRLRTGRVLVIVQIGLSLLLLTSAGLLLRTLAHLKDIDSGFDTEKLLVFQLNPAFAGYQEPRLHAFYDQVQASLEAIPGVRHAALTVFPLLDNKSSSGGFSMPGRDAPQTDSQQAHRLVVSETFFQTLGIPLVKGRPLNADDAEAAPRVIVINEAFARKYFPDEDPLGRTIHTWRTDWRIVGVYADTKYQNIRASVPPTLSIPFRQFPLRFGAYFVVRTALPPLDLATAVHHAVALVDPAVPVARLTTQEQLIEGTISQERMSASLGAAMAGFALLLSCLGLYGLMTYNVARRTGEVALRMALGACPWDISRAVLREALVLVGLGIAIGLPAAAAGARLLKSHLYGIQPVDPLTFAWVTAILAAVALIAALIPARRAAKIDPMIALRME